MFLRRGHTVVEALCALVLGVVLAAAAGLALSASRGALERAEERDVGGRAEREAVAIVRRGLATGEAAIARGDTAVEFDLLLGVGVACAIGPRELLLPSPSRSGLTAIPTAPTADDLVAVRSWESAGTDWQYALVESIGPRLEPSRCTVAEGWRAPSDANLPLLRVVLADSLAADVESGAEVRFYRRGRFVLYHAGRGDWMLGWRRCHPWSAACGPVQPVAGPLRAAGAAGFRVWWADHPSRWELRAQGVGGRGASASVPQ